MEKPLVVSRGSWHYRLLVFAYGSEEIPKTLCGYFWMVVLSPITLYGNLIAYILRRTLVAAIARIIGLGTLPAAIILSSVAASALTAWGLSDWWSLSLFAGFLASVLLGGVVLAVVVALFLEHRDRRERPETTSAARLLLAAVKAKKRKICPLLSVRDELTRRVNP